MEATRFMSGVDPSGLDHIYSNQPQHLSEVQIRYKGGSDHRYVMVTRYTKSVIRKTRVIRRRSFKRFVPSEFISELLKLSWLEVYLCDNVNQAVDLFSEKINYVLDKLAPVKTIQVRNNYAPWLSHSTKQMMKERDIAQNRAAVTGLESDWHDYRQLRNKVNRNLRNEKAQWRKNKLKSIGGDSSLVWKNLKDWFGWKKQGPPTQLCNNGNMYSKPSDLTKIMNEHFIKKIQTHVSVLDASQNDPIDPVRKMMELKTCNMELSPVHPDQIDRIIAKMKNSSSCGLDTIDMKIIKLAKPQLLPVITHIVNLSISTQTFPESWKTAKIIPLHKKKSELSPENYCPVSLLSSVSKIAERAIFEQLVNYFEKNDLIHPSHHGFRSGHNTTTALIEMMDLWVENFEEGKISAVVTLDMSAAFDLVDKDIFLQKLSAYKAGESVVNWVKSYLSGRKQRVYIDGCLSEELSVETGVPQGSILGPLFYVIYTSDLPHTIHNNHMIEGITDSECKDCGSLTCYADGST